MKFMYVLLMMVCVAMIATPFVNGATVKGIYSEDIEEITSGAFDYPAASHIRDNFYAIGYQGVDSDGFLRIIELDDLGNIIDANVDEWEFDTGYASNINIINLKSSIGLSVIGYDKASNYIGLKTFRLYQNGTIIVDSSISTGGSTTMLTGIDIVKTSDSTFIYGCANSYSGGSGYGRLYVSGYTVSDIGGMTKQTSNNHFVCAPDMWNNAAIDNLNIERHGSTCVVFNKALDGTIRKYTRSCTPSSISTNRNAVACSTTDETTSFLSGETHDFVVDYNEDNGMYYTTYGETADQYPTINIINASSFSSLYHKRLNTDTGNYNTIDVIGQNNALLSYNDGTYLLFKTYVIADNGTAVEQYTKTMTNDAARSDFSVFDYDATTATTKLLGAYETSSGDAISMGVGTVPPPTPADTQVNLKDERTLEAFNMTDKTLTFYAHCEANNDFQQVLTSTTTNVPVDCNYTSFEIKVEYEISSVNYAYSRYYLRDITDTYEQFTLDSYLVNPLDTDYVSNEFVIDDLTDAYENARLYFDKNINGVDTQITASYIDLTNSMRAILMNGERYYVYLEADNFGRSYLGPYLAPAAGAGSTTTTLHLYDISLIPTVNKLVDLVSYQVYGDENKQVSYLVETENGADNNLINATLTLYNGSVETGSVIYTTTSGGEYDPDNLYGEFSGGNIDMSAYENNTVNAKLHFFFVDNNNTIVQKIYTPTMWSYNKIELPLMSYVSQGFMDWVLIILLSIVAVFATIKSADMVSLAMIGLAALFVMFGWFSVSSGTLALAALVAFISYLGKTAGGEQ